MKYHNYPTIRYSKIVTDTNIMDKTFDAYVSTWMERNMPGFSLDLLDTDNTERWQLETPNVHSVEKATATAYQCEGCGDEIQGLPEAACCTDEDEEGKTVDMPFKVITQCAFVIRNESTNELLSMQGYIRGQRLNEDRDDFPLEGEDCLAWTDEADANEACDKADQAYEAEHGHESRYGFPWANSWVFMPDSYVSTHALKAAGFTVATYIGGSGNWQSDSEFRVCGIDGGGYSFKGAHFAKLCALHHEEREIDIQTDNGPMYVTMDERSELEVLADVAKEAV